MNASLVRPSLPSQPLRLFLLAPLLTLLLVAGCRTTDGTRQDGETARADTAQRETAQRDTVPRTVPYQVEEEAARPITQGIDLDTVRAGRFDQGRMWTFEYPPTEYLQEEYGFSASDAWYEDVRLSSLRIPGCSASFASPNGLVLTNHHCARSYVAQVSRPGENLLDEGFYARSLDEERPVEGLYADQLVRIRDVTDEIQAQLQDAQTPAERTQAEADAVEQVEQRLLDEVGGEEAGYRVQVVSLYQGGRYSAYTFRRYTDVRLVMAPELQMGYYGGDADNFTYPRYALDMSLLRVYDDRGEPLDNEHYFEWAEDGSDAGDLVFVIGNPGSTFRLETVAQLEYRRDVREPAVLRFYTSRAETIQDYLDENPDEADADTYRNMVFSFLNAQKLYEGRVEALRDEYVMARRRDTERRFEEGIRSDTMLLPTYGGLIQEMEAVQEQRREFAPEYRAFVGMSPGSAYVSATLARALLAYQFLSRQQQGADDEALAELREGFLGVAEQPDALDRRLLATRLQDFQQAFGDTSQVVQSILVGRSPEEAAESIVASSVLSDSARATQALEQGTLTMDDPAVQAVEAFMERYSNYQSAMAGLGQREQELGARLGRARFEIYGTDVPPDATFSLRISDGVVQGYAYNGTYAAPYTSYYGLYDHYYSYGEGTEWDLPERWVPQPDALDLSTPLDLVSTNDIIGGNSGSPLINRDRELVGLIFDGNIESLLSSYIYMPQRARAVSVDVRGMLEALGAVYDVDRLVLELTTGRLVESEAEADAVRSE